MPPDAYFPDKVTIVVPALDEEQVTVAKPAPAAAPATAPESAKETQKELEPEVQAKEVVDEPKPEETKE
jgi:hypothetical protein